MASCVVKELLKEAGAVAPPLGAGGEVHEPAVDARESEVTLVGFLDRDGEESVGEVDSGDEVGGVEGGLYFVQAEDVHLAADREEVEVSGV